MWISIPGMQFSQFSYALITTQNRILFMKRKRLSSGPEEIHQINGEAGLGTPRSLILNRPS
jgi:hypothetical protein